MEFEIFRVLLKHISNKLSVFCFFFNLQNCTFDDCPFYTYINYFMHACIHYSYVFSEEEGAAEHWFWSPCCTLVLEVEENFIQSLFAYLFSFLVTIKKFSLKNLSWQVLFCLDYWIVLICLITVQNQGNDTQ